MVSSLVFVILGIYINVVSMKYLLVEMNNEFNTTLEINHLPHISEFAAFFRTNDKPKKNKCSCQRRVIPKCCFKKHKTSSKCNCEIQRKPLCCSKQTFHPPKRILKDQNGNNCG